MEKQDLQQAELIINANMTGYIDLVLLMNDLKSFNLVKEHEVDLFQAWNALKNEYKPMTADVLIDLLRNFNNNKLDNLNINVTDWITKLELTRQRLYTMGHQILDGHLIMHILVNLLKEYAMMSSQLYAALSKGTLTIWEPHDQLKIQ